MEQEHFLSGYCRTVDQSRMVTVVTEEIPDYDKAKACFKGAWIGLGLLGAIVALFGIFLLSAVM